MIWSPVCKPAFSAGYPGMGLGDGKIIASGIHVSADAIKFALACRIIGIGCFLWGRVSGMWVTQGVHHAADRALYRVWCYPPVGPRSSGGRGSRLARRAQTATVNRPACRPGYCCWVVVSDGVEAGFRTGTKFPTTKPPPKRHTTRTIATKAIKTERKVLFCIGISH